MDKFKTDIQNIAKSFKSRFPKNPNIVGLLDSISSINFENAISIINFKYNFYIDNPNYYDLYDSLNITSDELSFLFGEFLKCGYLLGILTFSLHSNYDLIHSLTLSAIGNLHEIQTTYSGNGYMLIVLEYSENNKDKIILQKFEYSLSNINIKKIASNDLYRDLIINPEKRRGSFVSSSEIMLKLINENLENSNKLKEIWLNYLI